MKQVYSLGLVALVFIELVSQKASAQCTCSGGIPATTVNNSFILLPTTNPVSTLTFPQFNPALYPTSTLSCVSLLDTISGISTTYVLNTAVVKVDYKFNLAINNDIEGPGISSTPDTNFIYGPDSLNANGTPGDTITYGPTNVFTNRTDSQGSTMVASYIGTGTIPFTYTINGGLTTIKGGINYKDSISTVYSGDFNLVYYLCPSNPLASSISGFTASDKGNFVQLQWYAPSDGSQAGYEIQYSSNGSSFQAVDQQTEKGNGSGQVVQYQFQYPLKQGQTGIIYFRIREVDANGNSTYSIVKVVNIDAGPTVGISTYPNPVANSLTLQFDANQTGDFLLELVSITGQVIQRNEVTLNETNLVSLNLSRHPASGVYFLRTRDITHAQQYVTKILIQ
jgi:hypothetical protein